MKKLLVILLLILSFNISSAQSGWGYVNYTSYKTHAGYGATNQYAAFPYTRAEFDNMLNTANSNTTITHTGETALSNVYNGSSPYVPHWGGDYYENYQLLCSSCNRIKGNRPMEYLRMKVKAIQRILTEKLTFGE